MARRTKVMIREDHIIGKTLKECLEDINTKLNNHVAHNDEKLDTMVASQATLNTRLATLETELKFVKWLSATIAVSMIGLALGLATHLFGG